MTRPRDIEARAFQFACAIASLCARLTTRGPVVRRLAIQLLDAGTSVGATLEEAVAGQSRADFIAKCFVALKEARETLYWLRLIAALDPDVRQPTGGLESEANQLVAIITAIVKNAKSSATRQ